MNGLTPKRIGIGALVIVAIGLVLMAARGKAVHVQATHVTVQTVREYIAEDAKTRLDNEYIIDMPVTGTLEPIECEEGDRVEAGVSLARVDPFSLQQQIRSLEALISQAQAQITGVDSTKPKPEDISAAAVRVQEMHDGRAIAEREHAIAEINYAEAKKEFDRIKALFESGVTSQSKYDEADRAYREWSQARERTMLVKDASDKALAIAELESKRVQGSVDDNEYLRDVYRAEIQKLQAELDHIKYDFAKTTITAPISGVILEKYVDDRRVLPAGTPLLKLGDLNLIEIECDVLSEEVGEVEVGDPVEITGKALNDNPMQGKVKRIYPSAFTKISALGIEQQRVKVIIDFDNSDLRLRPGTRVDVKIVTDERAHTLAVPERATFRHQGQWAVFAVRNRRAILTPIEVGLKNDDWAEVVSGLEEGDLVVAEPSNDLEDRTRVSASAGAS